MESLVKFTQEGLKQKNDAQLRQILRRDFSYARGTSIMNQQELIDKILELKQIKQDEIDSNSGINQDVIHTDLQGNEWKIDEIKDGLVHIQNNTGHKTNTTITSFLQSFHSKKYCTFTIKDEFNSPGQIGVESEQEAVEPAAIIEETVEATPNTAKEVAKPTTTSSSGQSKSEIVRSIIKKQYDDEDVKMTSGTVMKELKDVHELDIHRSFCSSLISKFKKSLDE